MTEGSFAAAAESYSPQRRTAILLTGTGTSGAYHAGVLRALHEAGVKLDVVAGRGIGVVGALFAAVDGAQRLWEERGFWRGSAVRRFYPWRPALRVLAAALAAAMAVVVVPLALAAAGLVVFPIDFVLRLVGVSATGGLVSRYLALTAAAFSPDGFPTWLPRLALLTLMGGAAFAAAAAWARSDSRRKRGPLWWGVIGPPLSPSTIVDHCWSTMWDLLRGATQLRQPPAPDLGRRYTELLSENIGQPGFRELLLTVHDLDARRDLVFALVAEHRRRDLVRRPTSHQTEARRAELLDLSGVARDYLADAVAASLAVPIATEPHALCFAADAYWRGETHRLCDRPGSLIRLVQELASLEVEQIIVVSAAAEAPGPHTLAPPRLDGRGRLGDYLQSSEAAALRDACAAVAPDQARLFTISPTHNSIGPFDFAGGFDDRSDRRQPLTELMGLGYEDAYHQFIEPVVGASGDRVGRTAV